MEIVDEKSLFIESITKRRWTMVEHTPRHPEELHSTILEALIEGKITPGQSRNTFIGQIKKIA